MYVLLPGQGWELQGQGLSLCVCVPRSQHRASTNRQYLLSKYAKVDLRFGASGHLDIALENQESSSHRALGNVRKCLGSFVYCSSLLLAGVVGLFLSWVGRDRVVSVGICLNTL